MTQQLFWFGTWYRVGVDWAVGPDRTVIQEIDLELMTAKPRRAKPHQVQCRKCNAKNQPGHSHCWQCGVRLPR